MVFNKVLVPLDGSKLAEGILPYVTQLARRLELHVTLIRVIDPSRMKSKARSLRAGTTFSAPDDAGYARPQAVHMGLIRARESLQAPLDMLVAQGIRADAVATAGSPASEIARVAQSRRSDLIAMSTHGRSTFWRGIMGSVADEVMRISSVPTLAVVPWLAAQDPAEGQAVSAVLLPLDGSQEAERALPYVEELAQRLSLEIILVRVIDTGGGTAGYLDDDRYPTIDPQIKAAAGGYLSELTRRLQASGLSVRWKVVDGRPGDKVAEIAREIPSNIVALASRGRSGLVRWWEGSMAETLVRSSGDPVLVIPAGDSA